MKKILFILSCLSAFTFKAQLNLTINNPSGSNSITCNTPAIFLQGSCNTTITPITYVWSTPSGVVNGATINVSAPGVYTVAANAGTLFAFQTISIGINTVTPQSFVTPTLQNVTCSLSSIATVTATAISPTFNITHQITSPQGGIYLSNTYTSAYAPQGGPGTYSYCLINNDNGCSTCKNFTVNSSQGYPTFSLTSPQNFTLGCGSKSVTLISIVNGGTIPPGGPVSYSLLFPGQSTTTPSGALGFISQFTINIPGTYTAITKDNVTFCEARVPFSVIQNTVSPPISVNAPNLTLSCDQPSIQIQSSSTVANTSFLWTYSSGTLANSNIIVSTNSAAPVTTTLNGNYSLTVTDQNNTCQTKTIVTVVQNLFPPKASISSNTNVITCANPTVLLVNVSTTGIPSSTFPTNYPVIGLQWSGPSPQTPLSNSTTYTAMVTGIYSLTAKDLNNGCTSNTTILISDNRIYPIVNIPFQYTIGCPGGTITIAPSVTTSFGGTTYSWTVPSGAVVANLNSLSLVTNAAGTYSLVVTNTLSGCSTKLTFDVWGCVGLDEIYNNALLPLYPNPAEDKINIDIKNSGANTFIRLVNALGAEILAVPVSSENSILDVKQLPKGLYFVYLINDGKSVATGKFIKQ